MGTACSSRWATSRQGRSGCCSSTSRRRIACAVQGTARILRDDPLKDSYPEAQYIVRVAVETVWVNCPRYIHRYTKVEQSRYVPKDGTQNAACPVEAPRFHAAGHRGRGSGAGGRGGPTRPRGLWRTHRARAGLIRDVIANEVKQSRGGGPLANVAHPWIASRARNDGGRQKALRATMKTRGKARSRCPSLRGG